MWRSTCYNSDLHRDISPIMVMLEGPGGGGCFRGGGHGGRCLRGVFAGSTATVAHWTEGSASSPCVSVFTCQGLHFWAWVCVKVRGGGGGGGSVTGRQARGEDKARGRACLFVSSFARHHRKRHFTGAVSSFFPINFIFFFQHIKTKPIRYMIYQWSIALLIIIYCNYCTEGLCALTSDFGSIGSKITGKQM